MSPSQQASLPPFQHVSSTSDSPLRFTFRLPIPPLTVRAAAEDCSSESSDFVFNYKERIAAAVADIQLELDDVRAELAEKREKLNKARNENRELQSALLAVTTERDDALKEAKMAANAENRAVAAKNREAGHKSRAQAALENKRTELKDEQAAHRRVATAFNDIKMKLEAVEKELTQSRAQLAKANAHVLKPLRGDKKVDIDIDKKLEALDGFCANTLTVGDKINACLQQKRMTLRVYFHLLVIGYDSDTARCMAIKSIWPNDLYESKKKQFIKWLPSFETAGDVPSSMRGRTVQFVSPIQDADAQESMKSWLEAQAAHSVTSQKFQSYLNTELLPSLIESGSFNERYAHVSQRTAGSWMVELGWVFGAVTKGVYTDGHDAPETIAARKEYLEKLKCLQALSAHVDEKTGELCMPNLKSPEANIAHERFFPHLCRPPRVVFVYHDESTIRSQDGVRHGWAKAGTHHLMQKTLGRGLMLSDFVTLDIGFLAAISHDGTEMRAGIDWDVKANGYFDGNALNEQWLKHAFPTFNRAFNQNRRPIASDLHQRFMEDRLVVGVWIFDCATSHTAFATDALRATNMNKGPGGKVPIMRDGWFINEAGEKVVQQMWMMDGDKQVPKGTNAFSSIFSFPCTHALDMQSQVYKRYWKSAGCSSRSRTELAFAPAAVVRWTRTQNAQQGRIVVAGAYWSVSLTFWNRHAALLR